MAPDGPAPIPQGSQELQVDLQGTRLKVFTYKPRDYKAGPLILVFHGVDRNASEYRDHARGMADRFGAIVAAPEFDVERFPGDKYRLGGLLADDGSVAP